SLPGVLKMELLASMVELATGVCESAADAVAALTELRAGAAEAADEDGLKIAAAGTHAFSLPTAQQVAPDPRYREFVEYAGVSARRQAVCGLHVHVGMPSAEACMTALEGVLPWLPVVLALSANSPFLAGDETGLMSSRAEVLAQLPRAGAPPVFGSYAEWEQFVERFVRIGLADGYTRFWWDVRPHPRFGTLEVRAPDQPTDVALTGAFAAVLQALCRTVLESPPAGPYNRGDYAQNRWAALRFGPRAELIHPDGERLARASELGAELLELVEPAARELGSAELLARIDPAACEGDRQLEVGRAESVEAVVADVAARTVRSG
ncbi:MAG: carboxylate-amine ligase, partial [Gaiellaceae bacterium]